MFLHFVDKNYSCANLSSVAGESSVYQYEVTFLKNNIHCTKKLSKPILETLNKIMLGKSLNKDGNFLLTPTTTGGIGLLYNEAMDNFIDNKSLQLELSMKNLSSNNY